MLCILYTIAVGTCLGIAGLLVERALPATCQRRWVWCVVIALSMTVPPLYQSQHRFPLVASTADSHPSVWAILNSHTTMLYVFWLSASAVLLLWGLANAWRVSSVVRASRKEQRDLRTPTIVDGVAVVVTPSLGPATVGVWRSRVLVPRWVLALPGAQRRYVMRHEEEHRRAHDGRLLFLMSLALVLTPWNLPVWWQLRRLSLAVEMDCDNRVVNALGDASSYGEMLLKIAQAGSRGPRLQPGLIGGAGTLERRLRELVAPAQLSRVQRYLLPVIAIGLLFLVLSAPHPVLGSGSDAHVTSSHQRLNDE